jgi:hypothetical protein
VRLVRWGWGATGEMGCHGREGLYLRRRDERTGERSIRTVGARWRPTSGCSGGRLPQRARGATAPLQARRPVSGCSGGRPPPDLVVVWGCVRPHQVVGWSGVQWMRRIVALGLAQFGACRTTEDRCGRRKERIVDGRIRNHFSIFIIISK